MSDQIPHLNDWLVQETEFSPRELEEISGMSQQLARLWRSRGHLPTSQKGRWNSHSAREVVRAYLLCALSKLGVAPSDSGQAVADVESAVYFFAVSAGDGACDFRGPRSLVEDLRRQYDEDLGLARALAKPGDERRFLVSKGGAEVFRQSDLSGAIENEQFEHFFCIDLLTAGKGIATRAGKPLCSFIYRDAEGTESKVRRLSHGR